MDQKKLLLLGGLKYLLPVIDQAHRLGAHVITADYLPDNVAHKYSDEYCNVSIIDKDAVLAKAKELQIPQYRIDEGFNISDTATDEEIGTYLTKVAGNIKTNSLPTNSHFAMAGKDYKKSDADALANVLVSKL